MMRSLALTQVKGATWLQVLAGSLLLALSAQIALFLPISPVPIALHSTMALFLGLMLGPYKAAAAVGLYLLEGAAGLPVFALGHGGLPWLLGPTGGYLLGYIPGAFLAGLIGSATALRVAIALTVGQIAIYACGLPYLALYTGWKAAWLAGLWVFIPGDVIKAIALSLARKVR